jgi:hypothetical protein
VFEIKVVQDPKLTAQSTPLQRSEGPDRRDYISRKRSQSFRQGTMPRTSRDTADVPTSVILPGYTSTQETAQLPPRTTTSITEMPDPLEGPFSYTPKTSRDPRELSADMRFQAETSETQAKPDKFEIQGDIADDTVSETGTIVGDDDVLSDVVAGDPMSAQNPASMGTFEQHMQSAFTQPAAAPPMYTPVAAVAAPNDNTQNVAEQQQQGFMAAAQSRGRMIDGIVPKLQKLVEELPSMSAQEQMEAAHDVSQDNELQQAVTAGSMSWNDILAENSAEPSISYVKLKTLIAKLTYEGTSATSSYKDTYAQFVSDKTRPRMRQVGANMQIWQGPKWLDS